MQIVNVQQGTNEWHLLRKQKITATDAPVIMNVNPWKSQHQLYHEKISDEINNNPNERMLRGIALEPLARQMFEIKTGVKMMPCVIEKNFMLASLDGCSEKGEILEIKCPGEKDHQIACDGKIPAHYYPQLQHQMYVADVKEMQYFSFDGFDGVIIEVKRNDDYITEMLLVEEKRFFNILKNRIEPPKHKKKYEIREEDTWRDYALQWKNLQLKKKLLEQVEQEEEILRKKFIELSDGKDCTGFGVSISQISRKGNIDYSKIPELQNVDLEKYRKEETKSWRIYQE